MENTDQAPKLLKPWNIWSDRREGGSADSVDAESAESSPLVIESVNYPTSKKVLLLQHLHTLQPMMREDYHT